MSVNATLPATASPSRTHAKPRKRRRRAFDRPVFLWVAVVGVLVFLFLPVVVVFIYSFNGADSLAQFKGWSFQWYVEAIESTEIRKSFLQSLTIASISAATSLVLGTAMAIGIRRASRVLKSSGNASVLIRLVSPETATAVALFIMFGLLGIKLSFTTVFLGHIALSLAFVVVIIQSRLAAIGPELEDAAMDLGTTRGMAVWRVVMPLLTPSIVVAGMLAFILSFDNFVTSFFTVGIGTSPLPLWIYSSLRFGVSPVVNALGMLMLVITLVVAFIALLGMRGMRKR